MNDAHTSPTAPGGCFDDDGIANRARYFKRTLSVCSEWSVRSWNSWNARFFHRFDGRYFVAHEANRIGRGANKNETTALYLLSKVGILSEKAVAGVNCVGVSDFRGTDNGWDIEVALR